jgi:hypothetical protein
MGVVDPSHLTAFNWLLKYNQGSSIVQYPLRVVASMIYRGTSCTPVRSGQLPIRNLCLLPGPRCSDMGVHTLTSACQDSRSSLHPIREQ